jgi:hypothetical protein
MVCTDIPSYPLPRQQTPCSTPEHAARLRRLAILFRAVSPFTNTLIPDIDIHSLVASYEHEARKKVLSAFYVAHPNSLPLPSLPRHFQAVLQISSFLVDKVSTKSISMSVRRSLTFPHFHRRRGSSATCFRFHGTSSFDHGLNVIPWLTGAQLLTLPPSRCHSHPSHSPSSLNTWLRPA